MMKEYGGCLYKEENINSKDINSFQLQHTTALNSGRAAIYYAVIHSGCDTLYLPYYTCPTIEAFLISKGIKVKNYNIAPDFLPMVDKLDDNEVLLWTNYCGCVRKEIIQYVVKKFKSKLILDNCQSLFSEPIDNIYNIYSIRKFIGVSCGAAVVSTNIDNNHSLSISEVKDNTEFLDVARRKGSNFAYKLYCENEQRFNYEYGLIPDTIINQLKHTDFKKIIITRKTNFDIIHNILGKYNSLELNYETSSAFMYPFYFKAADLHEILVENAVYAPRWWKHVLPNNNANTFEKKLTKYLVPLPIDQRYTENDMISMIKIITNSMEQIK